MPAGRSGIATIVPLLLTLPAGATAQHVLGPGPETSAEVVEAPILTITLEDAIEMALVRNPQVLSGKMTLEEAVAARKQARAGFLPTFQADASALYYNEKPGFGSMGGGGTDFSSLCGLMDEADEVGLCNGVAGAMGGLSDIGSSFKSKQYNISVSIQVSQPLTPLYQAYQGYKIAELGVDMAEIEQERIRADLVMQTVQAYYQILMASAALEALDGSIEVLEDHLKIARAYYDAKLMTKSDVLQAEVRLAKMLGTRLEAEHVSVIARESLLVLLDEPPGTLIVLAEDPAVEETLLGSDPMPGEDDALDLAKKNRPELKQLAIAVEQAELAVKLAKGGYIPSVVAFGSYQYQEGSVMEQPEFTVGGTLSWKFWQWGKVHYEVSEAKARKVAAEAAYASLERNVMLEVKQALLSIELVDKEIKIQEKAVEAAEEQLRLEQKSYEQKTTTSTEVLDASARLLDAQVSLVSYRYQRLIALARLKKAIQVFPMGAS